MLIKNSSNDQVLTVHDMAEYLKMDEKTILDMVQASEIPAIKIANQWHFRKDIIDNWLTTKMHDMPESNLVSLAEGGATEIPLEKIINEKHTILNLLPGDRRTILEQLLTPIYDDKLIDKKNIYLSKLLEREMTAPTVVDTAVAMPHLRNISDWPFEEPHVVIGICKEGVDFKDPDLSPTKLFFLICSKSDLLHLRIMARIALVLNHPETKNAILNSTSSAELIAHIVSAEKEILKKK